MAGMISYCYLIITLSDIVNVRKVHLNSLKTLQGEELVNIAFACIV